MQSVSSQTMERREAARRVIETLPVVRNFQKVIEARDMSLMNKELYSFLNLYCGFIAHYNIHGFRDTYTAPGDFADVFIRHFDEDHRYFCGNYNCHEEAYQDTGYNKAQIKQEFFRIVDQHKEAIGKWADGVHRARRLAVFQSLKKEFERQELQIHMECEHCGENFDISIEDNGNDRHALENLCCLFCSYPIKIN